VLVLVFKKIKSWSWSPEKSLGLGLERSLPTDLIVIYT